MELIKTNFGFHSTADQVMDGIDLTGKRAIVTGASSGIGIETARALAKAGAEVTMAVRNVEAGNKVASEIIASTGNKKIYVAPLNLEDLQSINTFVASWQEPLHILINNAGVMAIPELQKTANGIEMQFMTNYLGHFALAVGLYDALASAGSARIVVVSSSGHLLSPVVYDDINFLFRAYDPWLSYGQAKTACILFAVGATMRWAEKGITVNALNPGAILTNLQKHVGGKLRSAPELHKTPQQGAATTHLLAASPLLDGRGGHYFENCNEAITVTKRPDNYEGVAIYALNKDNADHLWNLSLQFLTQLS
ncbi:SDR family NAD(P)-dependent oxidoreductase [Rhodocytophaga aerolata]|uniref:SDR family NAD(P)-dependent oxidoreductase n=1 Tax=Rhodocytophaga aerolata TaxID=455078 RepID=A0ABT8REN4_9BACT|nr:SDR family NAD(P)-dependent oxidoreductase [Rhodocytophaga aerolata]MDO1450525.1 SDR family NAD(P)-dependent oxidoreductase [Rhodocytophaga aerolata]